MNIEITDILGLAVLGAAVIIPIKKNAPEFALAAQIALICIIFAFCAGYFYDIIRMVGELSEFGNTQVGYAGILLKAGGVTIAGSLASDICRDSGETALAGLVDLVVRAIVISLSLPIIKLLLQMSFGLLR